MGKAPINGLEMEWTKVIEKRSEGGEGRNLRRGGYKGNALLSSLLFHTLSPIQAQKVTSIHDIPTAESVTNVMHIDRMRAQANKPCRALEFQGKAGLGSELGVRELVTHRDHKVPPICPSQDSYPRLAVRDRGFRFLFGRVILDLERGRFVTGIGLVVVRSRFLFGRDRLGLERGRFITGIGLAVVRSRFLFGRDRLGLERGGFVVETPPDGVINTTLI
ncbi:hypothetical protein CR513_20176, partial [Mucuna pruriens]